MLITIVPGASGYRLQDADNRRWTDVALEEAMESSALKPSSTKRDAGVLLASAVAFQGIDRAGTPRR
jgi:hypothetical protein